MIAITDIFIKYGDRVLFDNINLTIGATDKLGLTGRNGAGKSTMLKVIAGEQTADSGKIDRGGDSTLAFLHQEMYLPKGKTVMEETLTAFNKVREMQSKLGVMQKEMEDRTDYESDSYSELINEFSEISEHFGMLGGDSMEADTEKILHGLGFKQKDFTRLTDEFSGGWQMRIELAKMLLQRPDYLLLDEPTNHLDIESIIWLEDFLANYPGAVLVISHDKQFLDKVTKRTVEIEFGKAIDYKASYSKFLVLRVERREKQRSAYENQQRVIAQKERTISRFMAKANKTKMAQSMQKQLDKMERVDIDVFDEGGMKLRFPKAPRSGEVVVEGVGVTKKYGELLVLQEVDFKAIRGDRVAFVGQNGQGKTTLAKILINEITASTGDVVLGHNAEIGYYAQDQSDALDPKSTVLEVMENHAPPEMRTKLRSILGAFMFSGEDVEKKVSILSGGERARLALACLLLKPFNLLVLDEPTNHLDIISKDILKKALMDYDGTLIVVSHDREFLAGLTDTVIEFRDNKLHTYLGDLNYFIEKRALNNMRELEMIEKKKAEKAKKVPVAAKISTLSYDERRQLQRNVSNAEKKINRIEKEIEVIEKKMEDPDFYTQSDADAIMAKYKEDKKHLDKAMEEWEEASVALEE